MNDLESKRAAAEKAVGAMGSEPGIADWYARNFLPLSIAVLVFGVIVLVLMAWTLRHTRKPQSILSFFGVPLIIVAAVFLVVAGFSDKQISPVIGLLGTIAGYLLGRGVDGSAPRSRDDDSV
ncbi:MAG TPA: hypothetical protein VKB93_13745 [Thermoanaerobaculia bacterium]|nr:hypothetical protein [Thermoanaerobaculia bacterium]